MGKKVYLIECSWKDFSFRDAEFAGELDKIKKKARDMGTVYSLQEFQDKCNDEEISLENSFILIG